MGTRARSDTDAVERLMLVPFTPQMRELYDRSERVATPKDAATIAVVRDGLEGLEVFLMRRQATMAFAAGMYVFPGGGVFGEDASAVPWVGPGPEHFATRFNCGIGAAHSLVVAAVRETFEETGVLLAGPDEHSVVSDTSLFHDSRAAIENHQLSFADFLHSNDLVLRADLLGAWSHWITPPFRPRRYDTRFFVAALPEGQRIDSISSEADRSIWTPISKVLESVESGNVEMMTPTAVTCRELSRESIASVLWAAEQRQIRAIEPKVVEVDGELWLETGREGEA